MRHADTFAGATVHQVSRGMQGYDHVTDALFLMLGPSVIVLFGLSIGMGLHWPSAGLFSGALVLIFMSYNLLVTERFIRSVNLKSNALDSDIGAQHGHCARLHALTLETVARYATPACGMHALGVTNPC